MKPPSSLQDPFEEYSKRRLWFLQEWEIGVLPLDVERKFWDEQAISFAQSATNLLTILNGGALVAIPSYTALAEKKDLPDFTPLILIFSIGLIATLLGKIFGFFACASRADFTAIEREKVSKAAHNALQQLLNPSQNISDSIVAEKNDAKFEWFQKYRWLGLLSIFISLFAFITGIITGSDIL